MPDQAKTKAQLVAELEAVRQQMAALEKSYAELEATLEQQRASEERLDQIISTIREVCWLRDARTLEVLYVNPAYETLWGRSRHSLYDDPRSFLDAVHPEDKARVMEAIPKQYEGEFFNQEYRIIRPDGLVRWVWGRTFPIYDEVGALARVVALAEDVTERKEAEQRRLELALERERTSLFSNFIRDAAHEFRTPLSVIYANLYMLERSNLPADCRERTQTLKFQAAYIGQLVEDMLAMSRLDSGYELEAEAIDLNAIVADVAIRTRTEADEKRHTCTLNLCPHLPRLVADERAIHRMVMNLMDNAIRFTPPGGQIVLRCYHQTEQVVVEVEDNGIGIPAEDLPHIFERFYRVDAVRSTRGVGLGLSIAQRIAEVHHGSIEVESTLGSGSVFRVWLPLVPPQHQQQACIPEV
ncbi:MAG: PAS domain-containing sensor histidine kinase [Anaerolineae bacterium]|nr:PAS domain-containing sensor histidine kinase [Anaerolineae bacterium]